MTIDEVTNYVTTGSRSLVCIYREVLEELGFFVMSFYIMGKPGRFVLSVEFDPIDMVDDGDGWIWQSEPMELPALIWLIERYMNKPIADWENVTKSGRLSFYEEDIDQAKYIEQEKVFKSNLKLGKLLLPEGLVWSKCPD